MAQADAEEGMVLLKNDGLLPLDSHIKHIVVVGSHADVGVLSGGGSSQVFPVGGNAVSGPGGPKSSPAPPSMTPHRPWPPSVAARPALRSILSAEIPSMRPRSSPAVPTRWWSLRTSGWPSPSTPPALALPDGQEALIAAVSGANRHTMVVLETGGPVTMPWRDKVAAVVEAWYPGGRGGEAIAHLLFGQVNPSGRLPVTFPASESQLPRPTMLDPNLPGVVSGPSPRGDYTKHFHVNYNIEGADVGYRWFERKGIKPLFSFGYGLSYTSFAYSAPSASVKAGRVTVTFTVTNKGKRAGADVPQVYLSLPDKSPRRLAAWARIELQAGQSRQVQLSVDPRLFAHFKSDDTGWHVSAGRYRLSVGANAGALSASTEVELPRADLAP